MNRARVDPEIRTLVDAALAAGWREVKTRKGFILRSPNGVDTVGHHYTHSDWRHVRRFRADLRQRGVEV